MLNKFAHQQKILQKMALTPQMRLSIKLLNMSTKDINEYIDSAVEANPFLKKDFKNKSGAQWDKQANSYEYKEELDKTVEDQRLSLLSQVRILNLKGKSLEIAEYLIYGMDDNGYIAVALEDTAKELFVSPEEVENCLTAIQSLDPPGIGARDIRECLQIQLRRMHKEDSLEYIIVSEFINELARNDVKKISKALDIEEGKVRTAVANIKKLNPRPGSTMLSEGSKQVAPDLIVTIENKKIRMELNRGWMPRLKLYNPYENDADIMRDLETQKFIKENMDSAKQLIDNLNRREKTMCRVADYILNFQKDKLMSGMDDIDTLTIKDISNALFLHPSTVNRTIANKYIQINNKTLPLKNLLSHGLKKANGEIASKTAIKKKIEELVKNEDKSRPLSDNTIREKLMREGILIQRRTIAKYRKSLRILPTYLRKKL